MANDVNIKEILKEEILKRRAQGESDENAIRRDIRSQEAMARIAPEHRTDMTPTMAYGEWITGAPLTKGYDAPESTEVALRKAFNARKAAPKQNLINYLQSLQGIERREDDRDMKMGLAEMKASQQGQKQLGAEAMKRLGSARMALVGLNDMRGALQKGASIMPEFATGTFGDNAFTESRRRIAEGIGRMQSGGAITRDEETRFMRLLPRFSDSDEVREQKMRTLDQELKMRIRELGADPIEQMGGVPSAPAKSGIGADGSIDVQGLSDDELDSMIKRLSKG